jgi:hypothetical protein
MSTEMRVVAVKRLSLAYAPQPWAFAQTQRAAIERHFGELRRTKPALWNGRVLLVHDLRVAEAVLHGACFDTDYASFLAWRDWGFPDASVKNVFAMGALQAGDGGFLLGVMASHTANAGKIYFPAGTPEPDDVRDGEVDLTGNVWRELEEETGLTAADVEAEPGWHAVFAGPRIAIMKRLHAREPAEELRARILRHLARVPKAELADIHIVRGPEDLSPMVLPFISAILEHVWAGRQ